MHAIPKSRAVLVVLALSHMIHRPVGHLPCTVHSDVQMRMKKPLEIENGCTA